MDPRQLSTGFQQALAMAPVNPSEQSHLAQKWEDRRTYPGGEWVTIYGPSFAMGYIASFPDPQQNLSYSQSNKFPLSSQVDNVFLSFSEQVQRECIHRGSEPVTVYKTMPVSWGHNKWLPLFNMLSSVSHTPSKVSRVELLQSERSVF